MTLILYPVSLKFDKPLILKIYLSVLLNFTYSNHIIVLNEFSLFLPISSAICFFSLTLLTRTSNTVLNRVVIISNLDLFLIPKKKVSTLYY